MAFLDDLKKSLSGAADYTAKKTTEVTGVAKIRLDIRTANSRLAREHNVSVTVTHFVLCTDPNHEACGKLGKYEETSGIVQKIDPMTKTVILDSMAIKAEDIIDIAGEIFAEKCEEGC